MNGQTLRHRVGAGSREARIDRAIHFVISILCIIIFLSVVYPLYFVVIASFSDSDMVNTGQVLLYPRGVSLYGYTQIFKDARIWQGYGNTLIYTIGGTLINLLFTLPAAYTLSRKEFVARRFLNATFVFTMFFSGGMIPTYMLINKLGLINTRLVMMLPFCVKIYNLILVRTFFEQMPSELYEASHLDGCSHYQYFIRVVLPLSKAVISVVTLYYLVGHWNNFFSALLYLTKSELVPLQPVLRDILLFNEAFASGMTGDTGTAYAMRYADQIKFGVIIVSTLPILVCYPFIQKYFDKGVMLGSIKG